MNKDALKTASGSSFHKTGEWDKCQTLFSVNPDIPILDALNSVSYLMSSVDDSILDAAMGTQPLQDSMAWLIRHSLESAKAVVDSLIQHIEQQEDAENTPTPMWQRSSGFVNFYMLDDVHIQRGPFGKYGPFPTANSLRQALDRLEAKFPDLVLVSRRGGLSTEMASDKYMTAEYENTLEKIAALGA